MKIIRRVEHQKEGKMDRRKEVIDELEAKGYVAKLGPAEGDLLVQISGNLYANIHGIDFEDVDFDFLIENINESIKQAERYGLSKSVNDNLIDKFRDKEFVINNAKVFLKISDDLTKPLMWFMENRIGIVFSERDEVFNIAYLNKKTIERELNHNFQEIAIAAVKNTGASAIVSSLGNAIFYRDISREELWEGIYDDEVIDEIENEIITVFDSELIRVSTAAIKMGVILDKVSKRLGDKFTVQTDKESPIIVKGHVESAAEFANQMQRDFPGASGKAYYVTKISDGDFEWAEA